MKPKNLTEKHIKDHLIKLCKDHRFYYTKLSDRYRSGIPDFIIVTKKGTWFVELKAPGKIPTLLQFKVGESIRLNGGNWTYLDTFEKVEKFIDSII